MAAETKDMIIVMQRNASHQHVESVVSHVHDMGYRAHVSAGEETVIIGVIGHSRPDQLYSLADLPGVDHLLPVTKPYKLASRDFSPLDSLIQVGDVTFGTEEVIVMAGPCAVEDEAQLFETAAAVKEEGCRIMRGGAFKPRSSPYSFQGLGVRGLGMLDSVRKEFGLLVVSEVLSEDQVDLVCRHVDILQIGTRNMQNFALLQAAGRSGHPILLKRGMSATLEEFLQAAEYILANNNPNVLLCERGIRTFETSTRNTLDISAVPVLKSLTHLPVVVDPSQATGRWSFVGPVARAAVAAGSDALIVEVHPRPQQAMSDGAQSLRLDRFSDLMVELRAIAQAIGRKVAATCASVSSASA
ncbi:MAG TPA: 3-deoxy-7-phosphoheptulonate synthase [Chloroflexota bacterium]|jgi:3-deoxy-7-phosphoheptulonate synthase|nr:3-deoxy-7-phosphoheptulonate synthase [Chloroflexota bacterium]